MAQHEIQFPLKLPKQRRAMTQAGLREKIDKQTPVSIELPRITRLMALAIKFDSLLAEVGLSYTELGRLGRVSRSRITQILNLLNLAPDLQERLLFLEPSPIGRDPIYEPALRRLSQIEDWEEQRRQFELLLAYERPKEGGGVGCLNKP
jgi:hypothetical protein